jgi:hypothetical protein
VEPGLDVWLVVNTDALTARSYEAQRSRDLLETARIDAIIFAHGG